MLWWDNVQRNEDIGAGRLLQATARVHPGSPGKQTAYFPIEFSTKELMEQAISYVTSESQEPVVRETPTQHCHLRHRLLKNMFT